MDFAGVLPWPYRFRCRVSLGFQFLDEKVPFGIQLFVALN